MRNGSKNVRQLFANCSSIVRHLFANCSFAVRLSSFQNGSKMFTHCSSFVRQQFANCSFAVRLSSFQNGFEKVESYQASWKAKLAYRKLAKKFDLKKHSLYTDTHKENQHINALGSREKSCLDLHAAYFRALLPCHLFLLIFKPTVISQFLLDAVIYDMIYVYILYNI